MGTDEDRAAGDVDQATCDRVISQALDLALVTTRLLRAWHSGEIDSQQSMEALYESVGQIHHAGSREPEFRSLQGAVVEPRCKADAVGSAAARFTRRSYGGL